MFIWSLVKEFAPEIIIGLLVAAVLGYIGFLKLEVSHLESKVNRLELQVSKYQDAEQGLKDKAASLSKELAAMNKNFAAALAKQQTLLKEKIAANEELKRIKLNLALVQLWNESKRDPDAATSDAGHVSEADSTQTFSLTDLFQQSRENDANHWTCVKALEKWQFLWPELQKAVTQAKKVSDG